MAARQIQHARESRLERTLKAIAHVAEVWLRPDSPWMSRAEREISRGALYSREMVRVCLTSTFLGYGHESLRTWVKRDLRTGFFPGSAGGDVLVLLPSTVFAVAWQAATAVWLAGACVILRSSRREPVFARLFRKSVFTEAGSVLPIQMQNVSQRWSKTPDFRQYTAVIAFGRDETIQQLQALPEICDRLISFGTKVSVVYVAKQSLTEISLQNLIYRAAWDAVLYETQGCLSPQCFYIEEGGSISPQRFAEKLTMVMDELDSCLPRKVTEEDCWIEEGFWQRWRFRESQGRAHIFGRHVVFHREPHFEPCGLKRVVFVTPVRQPSDLVDHLGPWGNRLSTIAVSDAMLPEKLKRDFNLGTKIDIRFCEIGQMHQPPPWWRNGGISLLRKLTRIFHEV